MLCSPILEGSCHSQVWLVVPSESRNVYHFSMHAINFAGEFVPLRSSRLKWSVLNLKETCLHQWLSVDIFLKFCTVRSTYLWGWVAWNLQIHWPDGSEKLRFTFS